MSKICFRKQGIFLFEYSNFSLMIYIFLFYQLPENDKCIQIKEVTVTLNEHPHNTTAIGEHATVLALILQKTKLNAGEEISQLNSNVFRYFNDNTF